MKKLLIIAAIMLFLGGVELFAQITYDFEFDMIGAGSAWLTFEIQRHENGVPLQWEVVNSWEGIRLPDTKYSSVELQQGYGLWAVRVRAGVFKTGATFYEERTTLGYNNYFFIDLSPPVNPHSFPPLGGDE
jgi:hypothetical protein